MPSKKRILSGIQPSGKLHLGNYFGAVTNWVGLQDEYETFYMLADLHALTTVYESPALIRDSLFDLAVDLLACGIDPEKSVLFVQSQVKAHYQLSLILSMITPLAWLERVPTYKDKMEELKDRHLNTHGFLGYPVLQAADILLYDADVVPVGKDQLPHLELTREICRRFNFLFKPIFKEPKDKLTSAPIMPGFDGRKMSKSYNNAVYLSDNQKEVEAKIKKMFTDPARQRKTDPGNADKCPVFAYHQILNKTERCAQLKKDCAQAAIGCVDCKNEFAKLLIEKLKPIWENRAHWLKNKKKVNDVLKEGASRAEQIAAKKFVQVKEAVGL